MRTAFRARARESNGHVIEYYDLSGASRTRGREADRIQTITFAHGVSRTRADVMDESQGAWTVFPAREGSGYPI